MSLRGVLRGFGLKVGPTTPRTFPSRARELVAGHPTLTVVTEALLAARDTLQEQLHNLERRLRTLAKERGISPIQYARDIIYPALALRKLAAPATEIPSSGAMWQARQELWAGPAAIAKISVLPTSIAEMCDSIRSSAESLAVRWKVVVQGTGLGWLRLEASSAPAIHRVLHTLRTELEREGGSLTVLRSADTMPAMDAWGSSGDALPLMLKVKQRFDPRGTLNPGRFVGGI